MLLFWDLSWMPFVQQGLSTQAGWNAKVSQPCLSSGNCSVYSSQASFAWSHGISLTHPWLNIQQHLQATPWRFLEVLLYTSFSPSLYSALQVPAQLREPAASDRVPPPYTTVWKVPPGSFPLFPFSQDSKSCTANCTTSRNICFIYFLQSST